MPVKIICPLKHFHRAVVRLKDERTYERSTGLQRARSEQGLGKAQRQAGGKPL